MEEKMMKNKVPLYCAMLSFLLTIVAYFFIKGEIPIHFNVNWEVDGYAQKEYIFLLSALPIIVYFLASYQKWKHGNSIICYLTIFFLIFMNWMIIAIALQVKLNTKVILPIAIGIILILLGNYMVLVKRNRVIGIRTPWNVRSDLSWKKTNRYGAYLMMTFGFFTIASGILQKEWLFIGIIIGFLTGVLLLIIFSYVWYQQDKTK